MGEVSKWDLALGMDHDRGVLDIGFSLYTAPTYDLVSEYFGVQEPRLRVGAEGHSTRA